VQRGWKNAVVTKALDDLLDILDLESIEVTLFRGRSPQDRRQRVFGGQVAGQALVAAGRTVDIDRSVHSLHAYFLRPGDPMVPILYEVDRIRDGRSFTTRRVIGIQHGQAIFNLSASFHVHEDGYQHQLPMPDAPDPEPLPTLQERMKPIANELGDWWGRPRAIDIRYVDEPRQMSKEKRAPRQRVWFRADGELPDDPMLHAVVVAYASDMTLLDSIYLPHGVGWEAAGMLGASLDHAMWFHQPFRADEWLLYDQESPTAWGARGLARGTIFRRDGALAVSVVQEGLLRPTQKSVLQPEPEDGEGSAAGPAAQAQHE
jgi:acyl-CoA thioesterase-2